MGRVKLKNNITSILFGTVLAAGLLGYLVKPDAGFSEFENRYLKQRPSVTLSGIMDGSFMSEFETYTSEQIPFRETFIKLKAVIERAEFKLENNGIIRGNDNQLFEKLLSYNKNLERNEGIIASFAEKADRDFYAAVIPNSFEIQGDRMPRGVPKVSEKSALDEFYLKLSSFPHCKTVDLYDMLSLHSDEEIYYHTDHHWTSLGAYYGYLRLCDEMGLSPVDMGSLKKESAEGFYGTYYSKYKGVGIKPDSIDYYDTPSLSYVNLDDNSSHDGLYDTEKLSVYDKYAMFMYGNPGMAVIEKDGKGREGSKGSGQEQDPGTKSLVLFKDSYANCLIPFLTYNYDRIVIIDLRYFGGSTAEILSGNSGADVLLLYNFMHLSEDSNFYKLLK
ncbi:MAG: hypothetical protein K5770_18905 [Lachnospiraceae bacterium]|nr:hypothetical protein [Lachnospiraceae bacterium]